MIPVFLFYREVYRGNSIPEDAFDIWANRGAEVIARYRRLYQVAPARELLEEYEEWQLYQMAACAVAEVLYFYHQARQAGESQSASVGSVSCTTRRGQLPAALAQPQATAQYAAASRYLDIYRGVGR